MISSKQKVYAFLDVINDKLTLLSKDSPVYIDPYHDTKSFLSTEELGTLLYKLEHDEKVLKVIQTPPPDGDGIKEDDYFYGVTIKSSAFAKYLIDIKNEPEYKFFKGTPHQKINNGLPNDKVLYITYTSLREILLNDFFLLAKPDFDSENDLVFSFLYQNPNRKHTSEDLRKAVGAKHLKSLHKIVENLGFTGELKQIFIKVTKDSLCFNNPITRSDLIKIGITKMKFPRKV